MRSERQLGWNPYSPTVYLKLTPHRIPKNGFCGICKEFIGTDTDKTPSGKNHQSCADSLKEVEKTIKKYDLKEPFGVMDQMIIIHESFKQKAKGGLNQ